LNGAESLAKILGKAEGELVRSVKRKGTERGNWSDKMKQKKGGDQQKLGFLGRYREKNEPNSFTREFRNEESKKGNVIRR